MLAFFGHHKCTVTSTSGIVGGICKMLNIVHSRTFHTPSLFNYNLEAYCKGHNIDFLSYINADYKYVESLNFHKAFHIIRDPRDIVISAYFSHKNTHSPNDWPELIEQRRKLNNVSIDEGLLLTIEFLEKLSVNGVEVPLFRCLDTWDYTRDNILELKYEDYIKDEEKTWHEILNFLEIYDKLTKENFNGIVASASFKRLSQGRENGTENIHSHYRKGISGDWQNYFKDEHIKIFETKYFNLLKKIGYQTS